MAKQFEDFCEDRARAGDGDFAIAFALMQLKRSQDSLAKALTNLGNGNSSGGMGAIEGLAMKLTEAAQIVADARG